MNSRARDRLARLEVRYRPWLQTTAERRADLTREVLRHGYQLANCQDIIDAIADVDPWVAPATYLERCAEAGAAAIGVSPHELEAMARSIAKGRR